MEHWNEAKIKDFAEVKGGKRLPKGKQLIKEPNSHPYIRIRDLGKTKYLQLNSEYEYVDDETQQSIARYIVNKGDILISVVGTIGLIGIVGETLDKANQTENCDKIINIKNVFPEYLYYYLISSFGQDEIRKGTVGAVQPKLPLKNVQNITIFYPSIEEQERIVNILSSVDEKIEMNNAINNNLEQQAQTLFKEWFIDYKPFNGVVPDNWKTYKLGDFLPVITGKKNANISSNVGAYPFFSCSQDITWTNEYSFEGNAILVAGNGDFNVKFYDQVFDLLLRLKGNYFWPAMWSASLCLDGSKEDPLANVKLATDLGITIGNSHHEPLMRSSEEWDKVKTDTNNVGYGKDWNYYTNGEGLYRYWEDGVERNKDFKHMITIGMRGERDTTMLPEGSSIQENVELLRKIIADQ